MDGGSVATKSPLHTRRRDRTENMLPTARRAVARGGRRPPGRTRVYAAENGHARLLGRVLYWNVDGRRGVVDLSSSAVEAHLEGDGAAAPASVIARAAPPVAGRQVSVVIEADTGEAAALTCDARRADAARRFAAEINAASRAARHPGAAAAAAGLDASPTVQAAAPTGAVELRAWRPRSLDQPGWSATPAARLQPRPR
jgi:hypothetical protein